MFSEVLSQSLWESFSQGQLFSMSVTLLVRRLYNLLVGSDSIRYGVFPTSENWSPAAAVTVWSHSSAWAWGFWTQIAAAADVTVEQQILGATLENFYFSPSAGVVEGEVEIGVGAAGAEVAVARFTIAQYQITFPRPVRISANTRIAARYRTSSTSSDPVGIKVITLTGF